MEWRERSWGVTVVVAVATSVAACSSSESSEGRAPGRAAGSGGSPSSLAGGAASGGGAPSSTPSGGLGAVTGGTSGVEHPPSFPRPIDVDGGSVPGPPPPSGTGGTPSTQPGGACAPPSPPSVPVAGTGAIGHCPPKACNGIAPDADLSDVWHQTAPAARYQGCTSVSGTLMVTLDDNVDLGALSCLEHVTGDVLIWNNTALQTLHGLEALTLVDGSFQLARHDNLSARNENLRSLAALGALQVVGKDLILDFALPLPALDGFGSLVTVGGTLAFHSSSALPGTSSTLVDISGFAALRTIGKDLALEAVDAIPTISGMGALHDIGGSLLVNGATDLTALAGLPSLTCIGKNVAVVRSYLEENPALKRIGPFPALTTIGGYVHVEGNPNLESIDLFGTVTQLNGGPLRILQNARLSSMPVASLTSVGDDVTFGENPALSDCPLLDLQTRLKSAGYSYQFTLEGGLSCATLQ